MVYDFIVETEEKVTEHLIAVAQTEGITGNLEGVLSEGAVKTLAECEEGEGSAFFRVDVDSDRFNPKEMALSVELGFQVYEIDVEVSEI